MAKLIYILENIYFKSTLDVRNQAKTQKERIQKTSENVPSSVIRRINRTTDNFNNPGDKRAIRAVQQWMSFDDGGGLM